MEYFVHAGNWSLFQALSILDSQQANEAIIAIEILSLPWTLFLLRICAFVVCVFWVWFGFGFGSSGDSKAVLVIKASAPNGLSYLPC